jgi:hypothetical protein
MKGLANEKKDQARRPQWIQTLSTCYQQTRFPSSNEVEMQKTIRESEIKLAK